MAIPLTKTTRSGKPYKRRPQIEAEIDEVLALFPDAMMERALRPGPGWISLECLLHLVREHLRHNDMKRVEVLTTRLWERVRSIVYATVPLARSGLAREIREEILGRFGERVAENGESLDYYEINFEAALRSLRIQVIRVLHSRDRRRVHVDSVETEDGDVLDADEALNRLAGGRLAQSAGLDEELFTREVLDNLKPEDRDAVMLCGVLQLEQAEAAKRLNVTERTIRNRLARAAEEARKMQEPKK